MNAHRTKYLLVCNTSDGLVAQLNGIVVQLQLARRLGLEPIVYLHERSFMFGGPNPYFDRDSGINAWDYYYEPIGVSREELRTLVGEGRVLTLSTASELQRLYRWEPTSWFMNPFGFYRSVENRADGVYPSDWWTDQRRKARAFLDDGTVRFRASIREQADRFVQAHLTGGALGLQLRGSDKFDFGVGPNLSRKVLPEEYFPHIDRYLSDNPRCDRIFVATDQRQWVEALEEAYPDKVVSFSEWSLSDTEANSFHEADRKAARGAEVLVDLLVLSRCDFVLKCHAAVGEMALVLNPGLDFIDLNYESNPWEAKSRILRPALVPLIRFLSSAWRTLSERGRMGLSTVVSVDGETVIVDPDRPRPLNTKRGHLGRPPRPPFLSGRFVSDAFEWALRTLAAGCFAYEARSGADGK